MFVTIFRFFRVCALDFVRGERGAALITFGLVLLPLMMVLGIAVDGGRAYWYKSQLQGAADAAALAAASAQGNKRERRVLAEKYFASNLPAHFDKVKPRVRFDRSGVNVTATYKMPTGVMSLVKFNSVKLDVDAYAVMDIIALEIALVLDVSGSMRHGLGFGSARIDVLKRAVTDLIDRLGDATSDLNVAVVPFTMSVNVGRSNTSFVRETDHSLFDGTTWLGCVLERAPPHHISDEYRGRGRKGKWHAYIWPPQPDSPFGYCKNSSDGTNDGYAALNEIPDPEASNNFNAQYDGPNRNCVRHPIVPLTSNMTTVKNAITTLRPEGNDGTILAPGVSWGLRVLSPGKPFTEGESYNGRSRKVMIVVTDGEQTTEAEYQPNSCTMARNSDDDFEFEPKDFGLKGDDIEDNGPIDNFTPYGYIMDSDPFDSNPHSWADVNADLDNLSLSACGEVKAAGGGAIEVFTIGVSDGTSPGTRVYDLLEGCATRAENHFYAQDSNALDKAFEQITDKLRNVHLSQ